MKLNQTSRVIPLLQAFALGKTIQFKHYWETTWTDIDPKKSSELDWDIFDYRIKPEQTLRPWKPEEVPVGALIRWKAETKHSLDGRRGFDIAFIAGLQVVNSTMFRIVPSIHSVGIRWNADFMANYIEYSLDHGKTWQPCGVYES